MPQVWINPKIESLARTLHTKMQVWPFFDKKARDYALNRKYLGSDSGRTAATFVTECGIDQSGLRLFGILTDLLQLIDDLFI